MYTISINVVYFKMSNRFQILGKFILILSKKKFTFKTCLTKFYIQKFVLKNDKF